MGMQPPPPPPGQGSTPPPPPPGWGTQPPAPGAPPPPPAFPPGGYAPGGYAPGGYPPAGYQAYGSQAYGMPGAERAGFGIRLGSYLLDGLLYGLLMAVFIIPGAILIGTAYNDCVTVDDKIYCPDGSPKGGNLAAGIVLIAVGILVVAFIYLRSMGKTGQTWGCKIVGIKVIGEASGQPIGFGRALGRQLFAGFISANIFYLGYLWMLWDDGKQTWQDKVVGSIVVKT